MKNYFLFFLAALFPAVLFSQTYRTEFTYDFAGNRISRKVIILSAAPPQMAAPDDDPVTPLQESRAKCLITISPNPTKGMLGIEIGNGGDQDLHSIYVYTSAGALLQKKQYSGNGRTAVDLSGQPTGVYLLVIASGNEKAEYKIIKE